MNPITAELRAVPLSWRLRGPDGPLTAWRPLTLRDVLAYAWLAWRVLP